MDPVIQQMCQCKGLPRPDVFRRWTHYLRDVVQPQLDELERRRQEDLVAPKPRPRVSPTERPQ